MPIVKDGSPTPSVVEPATPSALAGEQSGWRFMLRALRHRNYRLFFIGQGVSLIGTWLSSTATLWLVFQLARESEFLQAATMLGLVRFAGMMPMSLLAPAAGVLVDRWNRHHVLVWTQALSMIQSIALAALTFTHVVNVTHVVLLSVFQGVVNAFDAPARQAFVVEVISDRDDLPNAIALNSSMFNGARLIGPAVAGLLIANIQGNGVAWCFAIDAISYAAVIIALLLMTLAPHVPRVIQHSIWRELREGFTYATGFPPVRALLLLSALLSLTIMAFQTLMPIFANEVSETDGAVVFGFLGAATGLGALAGALFLATRRTVLGLGRSIAIAAMLAGVAMSAFALTRSLPIMLLTAPLAGLGMIVTFAASNTLLQTIVEDHMRARLMSFFVLAVMGAAPLGSLICGWTADIIGESRTVFIAGLISVLGGLIFLARLPSWRAIVRPIYVRKGILPEIEPDPAP